MKVPKKIFDKYMINLNWFKKNPNSIHGVLHEYRVLVYAYLIGTSEKADVDSICYASIFHDVRRYNDSFDIQHGKRAGNWFYKNFNFKNKDEIRYLIDWHTPKDSDAPEMTLNLKCFKDADALDRWRIGDFDKKFLRTKTSKKLIGFSKQLYELTEKQKEKIKNPKENMLFALEKLKSYFKGN